MQSHHGLTDPFLLAKGQAFSEPTKETVPPALVIGQFHFIVGCLNHVVLECPMLMDQTMYEYGRSMERKDMLDLNLNP